MRGRARQHNISHGSGHSCGSEALPRIRGAAAGGDDKEHEGRPGERVATMNHQEQQQTEGAQGAQSAHGRNRRGRNRRGKHSDRVREGKRNRSDGSARSSGRVRQGGSSSGRTKRRGKRGRGLVSLNVYRQDPRKFQASDPLAK